MKKLVAIVFIAALLTACGTAEQSPSLPSGADSGGFVFETESVSIGMGEKASPVLDALGEPFNYFEAPSCAFEGLDKIYYYGGFELYTYPVDDEDFISSISFTDDSVTTGEGVCLGMTLDDMVGAYGDGYTQNSGQYTYTWGDTSLSFLIEGGGIVSIVYNYDELN